MEIRRTTIPYIGRSRWGADGNRKTKRRSVTYSSGGVSVGGGGIIPLVQSGTASCELSVAVSYIYATDLPTTISMDVIGQVDNQRVPTYVQLENITGGYPSMTITCTDNGTDHAVLNVSLPSNFNATGKLTVPVLVNSATGANVITPIGTQTMEDAFTARTKTTKAVNCFWEYSILHVSADGVITRGPVKWSPNLARRFSNGQGPLEEDRLYMDLIRRQQHTYKCITSYTQTAGQVWAEVSSNWELDDSFSIWAAGLDLDEGEHIDIGVTNSLVVWNGNGDDVINISTNGIAAVGTITAGENRTKRLVVSNTLGATTCTISQDGAIATVGTVNSRAVVASNSVTAQNMTATDQVEARNVKLSQDNAACYRTVPAVPFNMSMAFLTSDVSLFDRSTDTWKFNGLDTHVSTEEYPYIGIVQPGVYGFTAGEYVFTSASGVISEDSVPSGVYNPVYMIYYRPDTIYFDLEKLRLVVMGVTWPSPQ